MNPVPGWLRFPHLLGYILDVWFTWFSCTDSYWLAVLTAPTMFKLEQITQVDIKYTYEQNLSSLKEKIANSFSNPAVILQ